MIKRAVLKPPRVFILRSTYRALGADGMMQSSSMAFENTRVEVVHTRVERVRMRQAAGPRAS